MDSRRIVYEELVAAYQESLTTVLRGFRSGPEFLETWVPDEDDVKSLLNILDAAQDAGLDEISIHIGPKTLRTLKFPRLERLIAGIGKLRREVNGEGIDLHVAFFKARLAPEKVGIEPRVEDAKKREHPQSRNGQFPQRGTSDDQEATDSDVLYPAYRERLWKALESCSHEGVLGEEKGLELLKASCRGISLTVLVDPSNHTIKKAAHHGAVSDVQQGLLETLCAILEGRPVQEGSDHAVIHLEYRLRDSSQSLPVSGVVMPENVDPAFALMTRLVRDLLTGYRQRTGYSDTRNFFDWSASAQWRALSRDERIERIQSVIDSHPTGSGMEVVDLEGAERVVVRFNGDLDRDTKQSHIMQIEAHLKATVEPTLQVYMQPRMDQNKLRVKGMRP